MKACRSHLRLSSRRLPLLSAQLPYVSFFQAPFSHVPALPHAAQAMRTITWQSSRVMGTFFLYDLDALFWAERRTVLLVVGEEELRHARRGQGSPRSHWWWYLGV